MSAPKKKILGPIEIVSFLAAIIIIGYITLKSNGGKVYERAESTEITNNPTGEGQTYSGRRANTQREDQKVEDILRQISDQFGEDKVVRSVPNDKSSQPSMSKDELNYINQVRNKKKEDARTDEEIDWFSILKASHKTYSKVKNVFEDAGIDIGDAERGVSTALVNEAAERTIYRKLEEYFDIPPEKTKDFAQKGQQKISDWARFVDENKE